MALWGGRFEENVAEATQEFGASLPVDRALYRQDIAGSIAHATMLAQQGIITSDDAAAIERACATSSTTSMRGTSPSISTTRTSICRSRLSSRVA
mgnify:CR=1 FL=1